MSYPSVTYQFATSGVVRSSQFDRNFSDLSNAFNNSTTNLNLAAATCATANIVYATGPAASVSALAISTTFTTTPSANVYYGHAIPKAWAFVGSAGTLINGFNISAACNVCGFTYGMFAYYFASEMTNANYIAIGISADDPTNYYVTTSSVSTFTAKTTYGILGTWKWVPHYVVVFGE